MADGDQTHVLWTLSWEGTTGAFWALPSGVLHICPMGRGLLDHGSETSRTLRRQHRNVDFCPRSFLEGRLMEGRMSIYAAFELERQLGRDELVGEVRVADLDTLCTSGTRDADTRTNEFFKYGALYRRTHTSMPKLQNLYQERHGCNSQPLGMWPPHSIWALWCQVLDSTDTAHALSCMNQ